MQTPDLTIKQIAYLTDLSLLHAVNSDRYPFLLESVTHAKPNSRYDILFAFPQQWLELDESGQLSLDGNEVDTDEFTNHFDQLWRSEASQIKNTNNSLPFTGGWFLYLGYELVKQIEPGLKIELAKTNNDGMPIAFACRIPCAIITDHQKQTSFIIEEQNNNNDSSNFTNTIELDITKIYHLPRAPRQYLESVDEEEPEQYLKAIETTKRYIRDGDIFQANLSRRWSSSVKGYNSLQLYRQLKKSNPAPFAAYLDVKDKFQIMSSSPERLVEVKQGRVSTRPIAGTHPRRHNFNDDIQQARKLLEHPKERAEHVMLIDLERNDLGRICKNGTIKVPEFMVIETYQHVHHIVSNIVGELRDNITPGQIINALFPGGTITGCPKVRCIEIINELEPERREAYTGSVGYVNHNGDLDLNILIRTITIKDGKLCFRAGAGIVADSVAERELNETRKKAEGMIRALQ